MSNEKLIFGEMTKIIGPEAMLCQVAEECSELSKACLKKARLISGKNPPRDSAETIQNNLNEEIADVMLCIDELHKSRLIDMDKVVDIMLSKNKATMERLRNREIFTPYNEA